MSAPRWSSLISVARGGLVIDDDPARGACPECGHALGEHAVMQTGDNSVLACQATTCRCVEIRSRRPG